MTEIFKTSSVSVMLFLMNPCGWNAHNLPGLSQSNTNYMKRDVDEASRLQTGTGEEKHLKHQFFSKMLSRT